jgi:hypothetical protein
VRDISGRREGIITAILASGEVLVAIDRGGKTLDLPGFWKRLPAGRLL